jgi:hypothetical protein
LRKQLRWGLSTPASKVARELALHGAEAFDGDKAAEMKAVDFTLSVGRVAVAMAAFAKAPISRSATDGEVWLRKLHIPPYEFATGLACTSQWIARAGSID